DAGTFHRPWQPDEHAGTQWLYRGLAGDGPETAAAESAAGDLRTLVLWYYRRNCHGEATNHTRFLWLSPGAVCFRLPGAGFAGAGPAGCGNSQAELGRAGP